MNTITCRVGATGLLIMAMIHPQESRAGGFTGAEFADWSRTAQDSYIQTSVTMAGVVLTQTHPTVSTCIDEWYLGEGAQAARNETIRSTIDKFGDHHPSGVILAVLLQACGPLEN